MIASVLVLAVASTTPTPIRVLVPSTPATGVVSVRVEARLAATSRVDSSHEAVVRTMDLRSGSEGSVTLPLPQGTWSVEVHAPGYWSPSSIIDTATAGAVTIFRLWATTRLGVSFTGAGPLPPEVAVAFRGAEDVPLAQRVPQGFSKCPLKNGRSTCDIPIGRLDLRLEANGFVPEYLWSHDVVGKEPNSLAPIRLDVGASVVGFVRSAAGAPPSGTIVELLTPSGGAIATARPTEPTRSAAQRGKPTPLRGAANSRGFFQLRGMVPGEYRIVAKSGFLLGMDSVSVEPERETRLGDFLNLEEPRDLAISIDPPLTPSGHRWTLKAVRVEPLASLVFEGAVALDGSVTARPLTRGLFTLEIWNGAERWFGQTVAIDAVPGPVTIKLPITRVRGAVTMGGEPLRATVVFGGRTGPVSASMQTDEDGRFSGSLPFPGDWAVGVESLEPRVTKKFATISVRPDAEGEAEVLLELPSTTIRGQVRDEAGVGRKAIVSVYPQGREDAKFQVFSDQDGRFVLNGLAEGLLVLEAQATDGQRSPLQSVHLSEEEARETVLILQGELRVGGVIQSVNRAPLPGAMLTAFPVGPGSGGRNSRADAEGRVSVSMPPGTREMILMYWADGHALELTRDPIPDGTMSLHLEPVGGSLVIDLGRETDVLGDRTSLVPVVVHKGAQVPLSQLIRLSLARRVQDMPLSPVMRLVPLPRVATGDYAVCLATREEAVGMFPTKGPCDRGVLKAGEELRLAIKLPESPSSK